jgi:ATP-dependent RNA helicase DDX24/MAK5
MAKKRKRSDLGRTATGDINEFEWKKIDVGLLGPSQAASTSHSRTGDDDDFDAGNNHYDKPASRIYRSAERDLQADPAEGVGMFLGLEVLDGSQYSVIEEGGHKRLVPKRQEGHDGEKQLDKKKFPKSTMVSQAEALQKSSEAASDNPTDKSKSKKKRKKKKAKKSHEANGEDSQAVTMESGEKSSEADGDSLTDKSKSEKKRKKKTVKESHQENGKDSGADEDVKQETTGETRVEESTVDPDTGKDLEEEHLATKEDVEENYQLDSLQNSWMAATGGVALQKTLCKSLLNQNFWTPTPIQAASLPAAILGRRNIVGAAPTGSGKTLAYLLPIFELLLKQEEPAYEDQKIQALILAPTRELAMQVQGECDKLAKGKCALLVGGMATQKQERVLRTKKPPIIIGTPGRLWEMVRA